MFKIKRVILAVSPPIFTCLFLAIVMFFPPMLSAQSESCVTVKCHASFGKGEFVHNPVKENMCTMCHSVTQETGKTTKHPGSLTITLMQPGAELCSMCHEPKNIKKVVHAPIMGGDCTSCHNPHQSQNKGLLKEAMPKLCFGCHPESMMNNKVLHPPFMAGDCSGCHDNHQSDFPNRLVQEENSLCFMCHPDKEEGLKTKKTIHPPVQQSCVQCHSPHGTPNKALLLDAVPALCSNCHPNEASMTLRAVNKHGPMNDEKSCMNCHDPHFSDQHRLLPAAQIELCLGCHNRELITERGGIADMKTFLTENKDGHGPVKIESCATCHNPHGSDYWRILVRNYPSDTYIPYSDGNYALCIGCHNKEAFIKRITTNATNFRNGDRNLHFLHVNKTKKGRQCGVCHEIHASSGNPKHLRETFRFGGWKMPLNYSSSPSGGSCAPGCHGEKKYTR